MYFYQTEKRIHRLIKRLPSEPATPGKLSEKKQDIILSSILLCSAELEDYIEFKIKNIVEIAYNKWRSDKKITIPLISFAHRMHPAKDREKIASVLQVFAKTPETLISEAYQKAISYIDDNHSLGEDNLINLLKMVGGDEDVLNSEISVLATFTRNRGAIAHKGNKRHGVTAVNSPRVVESDIKMALAAAKSINQHLDEIKKKI